MTTTNSYARQPTSLDYASPTQFKFSIVKLPKVEYFCTAIELPGMSITNINQPTMLKGVPLPGNDITYEDLQMTFMVDENLDNYQEIAGWIRGLAFPEDHTEFANLQNSGNDRFPGSTGSVSTEAGKVKYGPGKQGALFSDATLTVLSSKNNPVTEVRFVNLYPHQLSGLSYNQQDADVTYMTARVTFRFDRYDFASAGSSTTTVVTS